MEPVDIVLHARWIAPVEPFGVIHENYSVIINDGRIGAVLPSQEARREYIADTVLQFDDHLLIPGLVNAHGHAAMSLLRGLADDLPLMEWLKEHIWPAEQRWISAEFVYDGSLLACAEMLRGGTTCFNDMYFFPEQTARAAEHAGIRAVLGLIVVDFPSAWAQSADEYLHKGLALHDDLRHNAFVHTAFAPHAPYTVADAPLKRVAMLAEELDIPIHMHVHETAEEVRESEQHFGMRPLARLEQLGLLSPRLLAVHMTQLTKEEMARCQEHGVHIVHCPESNLKLASGFCPVQELLDAGINVALGSDGAASNNDLDMLGEMRSAALLGKAVAANASAVSAAQVLRMATLNGARALGLEHETGSIEVGKSADLVAVDLSHLETQPVFNPVSQLVYAASRHQVSDVWVGGRHVVKDGVLATLDPESLRERAQSWHEQLSAYQGADGS